MKREFDVGKSFSRFPAGRTKADGPRSGELFRETVLIPNLTTHPGDKLVLLLDSALGYGSSFLDEAFGGVIRAGFSFDDLKSRLEFSSSDPALIEEINDYMDRAEQERLRHG